MSSDILTVTLNPALDVNSSVPAMIPQQKLRCAPPHYMPGGGGINVSRAIRELGGDSHAFVVLGGGTGAHYRRLLEERGIGAEIWPTEAETRFSFSVLDESSGSHYRYVLPGPTMAPVDGDRMLARLSQMIAAGYRYVVASGSLPPGLSPDFYGRMTDLARAHGARLVLDTQGEALRATLPFHPHVIRLADYEARDLVGSADRTPGALAQSLRAETLAEIVIITLGERGAVACTETRCFEVRPPRVEVHSAVGAGDSFVAALTLGLSRNWTVENAVRYGVAAAASAVTTSQNQLCEREKVDRYFAEIGGSVEQAA
jgi:6-phosphofructokinase 2